jgi:hypothetical protein
MRHDPLTPAAKRPRLARAAGLGRLASIVALGAFVVGSGCASSAVSPQAEPPSARARYKPGQSLAARLCECRECFEAKCCDGDPDDEAESADGATELGMALTVCGRCVRRTWTVRGSEACAPRAPSECCAGSIEG